MADLIRDASYEMNVKEIQYIQSVLHSAADNWSTPFYGAGTGIVKSVLNPMIQHWMRTGSVTLLGDVAVISKLAEQTGFTAATATQQYSPSVIEEVMRTGLIGTYYGAASSDMRPLKVVYEGSVQSVESTNIDDLAYEIRLDQWFGAGIVTGKTPTMSVYEDESA